MKKLRIIGPKKTRIQITETSVVRALSQLLANTYCLYLKTQNYHWNVTGPHFHTLHHFFELNYKQLAEAIDQIAEHIRTFEAYAPGSLSEFKALTTLPEATLPTSWKDMLENLTQDHQTIVQGLTELLGTPLIQADRSTEDLLIERLRAHQKVIWMLKAHLE